VGAALIGTAGIQDGCGTSREPRERLWL
jgi:hypothetical protein